MFTLRATNELLKKLKAVPNEARQTSKPKGWRCREVGQPRRRQLTALVELVFCGVRE